MDAVILAQASTERTMLARGVHNQWCGGHLCLDLFPEDYHAADQIIKEREPKCV